MIKYTSLSSASLSEIGINIGTGAASTGNSPQTKGASFIYLFAPCKEIEFHWPRRLVCLRVGKWGLNKATAAVAAADALHFVIFTKKALGF